jgi:hypothetical protein
VIIYKRKEIKNAKMKEERIGRKCERKRERHKGRKTYKKKYSKEERRESVLF